MKLDQRAVIAVVGGANRNQVLIANGANGTDGLLRPFYGRAPVLLQPDARQHP